MLDNYDRGEVTPPPAVSGYGGSPGLLALHSSLYATPTSRAYDIDSGIDGNDSSMPIDTQIISVSDFFNFIIRGASIFLSQFLFRPHNFLVARFSIHRVCERREVVMLLAQYFQIDPSE